MVATAYLPEQTVVTLNAVKRGGDDLTGWGRGVMAMSGNPAKCLDCGQILAYGGGKGDGRDGSKRRLPWDGVGDRPRKSESCGRHRPS